MIRLTFDKNLTLESHVNKLTTSLSRFIGVFSRVSSVIPNSTLVTMYNAFIHSKISYAIEVWYGCSELLSSKVFVCQKRAIRIINRTEVISLLILPSYFNKVKSLN